jgi:hypothetical protein
MSLDKLLPLLKDHYVLLGVGIAVGLAFWLIRWVRSILTSERPDDALSNLGMLVGLGWSSEAVWTLTGPSGADLITPIRIALFAVFEVILIVFMIRAKRNQRLLGHPGRSGRYAWVVAAGMSLVAVWTAHNAGEAFLRLLVPLLLTLQWWDGLVGEGAKRDRGTSSWRWTLRRLLLWLGAIEPGERDIETVHLERLTQQMTRLEFRRRHGREDAQERAAKKLARLSLTADDSVITAVRERVDRATWFEAERSEPVEIVPQAGVSAGDAAARMARRVFHRRALRTLRVKQPRPVVPAAPRADVDPRSKQDVEDAVRFIVAGAPGLSQRQVAALARTSLTTVNRVVRNGKAAADGPRVNGRKPELTGAVS